MHSGAIAGGSGISERVGAQCRLIAEHARLVTGAARANLVLYDEPSGQLVTVATTASEIPLQGVAIDLIRRNYPGLDMFQLSYPPNVNKAVASAFVGQRTQVNDMAEAFEFLAWVAERLAAEGVRVLALIWDNAPWHVSREVRTWIRDHNRKAKRNGGCRLLVCRLPSRSPWLNPIEPRWAHGKRAVVEPERKLTGEELEQRLCHHYRCQLLPPLAQPVA